MNADASAEVEPIGASATGRRRPQQERRV
jgi:hypothetical protein